MQKTTLKNYKLKWLGLLNFTLIILFLSSFTPKESNKINTIEVSYSTSLPIGSKITLRGNNNRYISSENGKKPMTSNRREARLWEKFTVVNAGNGRIALKASNGKYVSSENGISPMMANRDRIGSWEKFKVVHAGNGHIALKASNGKYVSSENGVSPMKANRNRIGSWEKFEVKILTPGNGDNPQITPPSNSTCSTGNFVWQNNIDLNNLSGSNGIPQTDVRLREATINNPIDFTQYRIPGPYPTEFAGPVTISIDRVVSWDGFLTRSNVGNQPKEQWKIVFLKDNVEIYSTQYTQDLVTGQQSAEWVGALDQNISLPNGTDEIILVHYEDDEFGEGDSPSGNSVVPVSICISFEQPQPVCTLEVTASPDQTICDGDEITLTATVDGNTDCIDCIEYGIENTDYCKGNRDYAVWLSNGNNTIWLSNVDLKWKESPNGTATLTGTVIDYSNGQTIYEVDAIYSGRTSNAPQNSPKSHECNQENSSDWVYYTQLTGTITRTDGSESVTISRRGPAFQIGKGANTTENDKGKLGASGWFNTTHNQYTKGDFNIILGDCITTQDTSTSFLWSTGETTQTITVSPSEDTIYTVKATNCNDCSTTDEVKVSVDTTEVSVDNQEICKGETATLVANGEGTFLWSTGETTQSIEASPTETTTYTITLTKNGCSVTDEAVVTVKEPEIEVIVEDKEICKGEEIVLTAPECEECVEFGISNTDFCTASTRQYVLWLQSPTVSNRFFTNVDLTWKENQDGTATLKGTVNYNVTNENFELDVAFTGKTTTPPSQSPKEHFCYDEDATNWEYYTSYTGTISSLDGTWTVSFSNVGPAFQVGNGANTNENIQGNYGASGWFEVADSDFKFGDININIGDCITQPSINYEWSTGETTQSITVSPDTDTTYTVTVTGCNDCRKIINDINVSVKDVIQVDAGEDQQICKGEEVILTADVYAPECEQECVEYGITNTDFCTASTRQYVLWLQSPTVSNRFFTNVDLAWKENQDGTATLKGIVNYNVTNENFELDVTFTGKTTTPPSQSPKEHFCYDEDATNWEYYTSYTGTISSLDGTWTVSISNVGPAFQVGNGANTNENIQGNYGASGWFEVADSDFKFGDININIGDCIKTQPVGVSYKWSTGKTTRSIAVSPDTDTTYTVTVTECNACGEDTDDITVLVTNAVADAGDDITIQLGNSTTLTSSQADRYKWSTGETTKNITVTPSETTTYTLTTTQNGCTVSNTVTVTVEADPCLSQKYQISATPIPVKNTGIMTVDIAVDRNQDISYEMYKMDGNMIGPLVTLPIQEGCSTFTINLGTHCALQPNTNYFLVITGSEWSDSIQFITE